MGNATIMAEAELDQCSCPREGLVAAVKRILRLAARQLTGECVLTFEESGVRIRVGGAEETVSATGGLRGEVRIPAPLLKIVAAHLPPGDPVVFRRKGEALEISRITWQGTWHARSAEPVPIPVNASTSYLLAVASKYPGSEIAKAGATNYVREAEERARTLMDRAAAALAPLEVTSVEIERLVAAAIRRRWPDV